MRQKLAVFPTVLLRLSKMSLYQVTNDSMYLCTAETIACRNEENAAQADAIKLPSKKEKVLNCL